MVATKLIAAGLFASQASAAILFKDLTLLSERADTDLSPGSPLYNCHDNCGEAILEVGYDADGVCSDSTFLTDYDNCLQCAGSDNEDIWKYYGSSLTSAAAACGLTTVPLTGTQAAVGTAIAAASGGGSAATTTAESVAASSTVATEASSTAVVSSAAASSAAATTSAAAVTSAVATSSAAAASSAAATSAAASSSSAHSTKATTTSGAAAGTGSASGTGSAASSVSSSAAVVTAGASSQKIGAGLAGIAALGAAYAAVY